MHSSAQSVPRDRKERGGGGWSGKKGGVFNTSSKDGGNWKVKVCVCGMGFQETQRSKICITGG